MGGRGTFASGNLVAYKYETIGFIEGVKVLQGIGNIHKLPEEAHSSNLYIRLKPDGTFHEMRIYDKDRHLTLEIAYHREPSLDRSGISVLHYHTYDKAFNRSKAYVLTKKMHKKYKKYFKGVVTT